MVTALGPMVTGCGSFGARLRSCSRPGGGAVVATGTGGHRPGPDRYSGPLSRSSQGRDAVSRAPRGERQGGPGAPVTARLTLAVWVRLFRGSCADLPGWRVVRNMPGHWLSLQKSRTHGHRSRPTRGLTLGISGRTSLVAGIGAREPGGMEATEVRSRQPQDNEAAAPVQHFVVIVGEPADGGSAFRVEDPPRLLRVSLMLQATLEQL